jgi:hypothetical protein
MNFKRVRRFVLVVLESGGAGGLRFSGLSIRPDFNASVEPEQRGVNRSHRALRDGSAVCVFPGNELPGYDHSVPSGHSS